MGPRLRWASVLVILLVGAGIVVAVAATRPSHPAASCTATLDTQTYSFTPEQVSNAATIAAVGQRVGMPAHAVTVALATALQESRMINLPGGDRDSAGLFQQRPSQGWGSYAQVTNPIDAAVAFYSRLRQLPNWQGVAVTLAAQDVEHSATPLAYAEWEAPARALAVALTGEQAATLTCSHLAATPATQDISATALRELGTTTVTATYPSQRGWALASWLVSHASGFGLTRITFGGRTWTTASGSWAPSATSARGTETLSYDA